MFLLELLFSGMGDFFGLVILIVLFVKISNLKKRVSRLEEGLSQARAPQAQTQTQSQQVSDLAEASVAQESPGMSVRQAAEQAYQDAQHNKKPSAFGSLINWLRAEWLMKLGSLLMLFGFGWFVNTNNFMGPMGSITFGILVGAIVLILGAWRIKNDLHQGSVFLVPQ